jgi:hypothetical protein
MFALFVLDSKFFTSPSDFHSFAAMEPNCAGNEITENQFGFYDFMDLPQAAVRIELLNILQGMVICTLFSPPPIAISTAISTNGKGVIAYVTAQLISSVVGQNISSENLISNGPDINLRSFHRVQPG